MATRFASVSEWRTNSTVFPIYDYLVALPDGFTGTSGVFAFKISDGRTSANRLPYAPNSAPFTLPGQSGGSVDIANVPLPVTSTDLNLEATQQQVLGQLSLFQFDGLGNLKTTGGGGGGTVDQGAAGVDPWLVDTGLAQGLTDAQLRATPVPVSGTVATGGLTDAQLRATAVPVSAAALPLPTGAASEATLSTLAGKIPANLTVTATRLLTDGSGVTQPVSGPLTDAELRATPVPVSGTVSTGALTDAQLRATPVPVSGTVTATGGLTDAELRAAPVPVSGPLTDAQLRAVPVPVSGTVSTGGLTDAELRASAVPISAAALPLPTNAATAALQTQPGVDIGDVTVNNAAGASAVNVQDGGNSLTVDAPVGTPAFVRLSDGAAAITTLPVSLAVNTPVIAAGSAIMGKVGIDQTTPGTTNGVQVNAALPAGNNNIGDVDIASIIPPTLTKGTQGATGFSVQDLRDAGRTTINLYTNAAVGSGATGVETAITLTLSSGTSATTTGTSFVVTSGKTLRITSVILRSQGSSVATIQATTFSIRINTAGAVTTASTAVARWLLNTPATANVIDRMIIEIPEGMDFFGDGTMEIGVTANSSFVTNSPNWHVSIHAYYW